MSELRRIPGVGAQTEKDLLMLGYPTIASLRGADPEEMYRRECAMRGVQVDRCQLYVYRCATLRKPNIPIPKNANGGTGRTKKSSRYIIGSSGCRETTVSPTSRNGPWAVPKSSKSSHTETFSL